MYTVHPQNVQLLNNPVTKRPVTERPIRTSSYRTSRLPIVQITRRSDYKTSSYIVYQPVLIRIYLFNLYNIITFAYYLKKKQFMVS
jgi:hypothetical protein